MPSATGEGWEKYRKNFADEEEEEKKITPLSDEYVVFLSTVDGSLDADVTCQGYPSTQDLRSRSLCHGPEETRETNQ